MASVSFTSRGGKKVSFKTSKRKGKRKPSPYNRFVSKHIRSRPKGQSVTTAMRSAAAAWRKK